MTTTKRHRIRAKNAPPGSNTTVLVDTEDATPPAAHYVYAVCAALGVQPVTLDATTDDDLAATIQVTGNTLISGVHQWTYPTQNNVFEHWLVNTCYPKVSNPAIWAVVQTGKDPYPLLAAAMAYAHQKTGALFIDANAAETSSSLILEAAGQTLNTLDFDFDLPSPHIYLLNTPRWEGINLLLKTGQANPLSTVLLTDTVHAARHHFSHTVVDCGADLFLAQRLNDEGAHVIHLDDYTRPIHVKFSPHKRVDYYSTRIPEYGRRRDIEFIVHNTRRRAALRRWMERGESA